SQRKGKLLLIDFWSTYCRPCRDSVPHLKRLQAEYGKDGLEVIGIGYAGSGSWSEQVTLIREIARAHKLNYRTLLGDGWAWSSVAKQLNIEGFPTFLLVDENGWIVWRHPGALDEQTLDDLEFRIRGRLGRR